MNMWICGALLVGVLAYTGCSGSNGDKDAGVPDSTIADKGAGLPDGYNYWPCDTPGQACNAHDPCAIDPVCGDDLLCHPSKLQDCDDGLDCTDDLCLGMGLCDHQPKEGKCALGVLVSGADDAGVGGSTEVQCFNDEDKNPSDPCMVCDAEEEPSKWSPANGGACDDGNDCTKDDYCQTGVCKGVYYGGQCADEFGCTEDICDGLGGCVGNQLKADWCLINGVCYMDQATHPSGSCKICDVSQSQSQWTDITNTCLIDGMCYQAGGKHSGGCAECDPAVSTTSWTVKGADCLISNVCYKPQATDPTGCSECDPTASKTAWTQLAGLCSINGQCYKQGDKHTGGCAECDTAVSTTGWTVKGSYCLISNVCKNPLDKDSTGCGECDPTKSMYDWTTVADTCLINGKCYTTGAKDATGCGECDPAINTTSWTVKGANCLIANTCYNPGDPDATNCATCDPTQSTSAWTANTGQCLINGTCYADGDPDTTGCLQCAFATDPTGWSPLAGVTVTTYDFESGASTGWTIVNSDTKVGWVVSTKRPSGGSYSLYYGDPAVGNYDTTSSNDGTATTPPVTLAANKKAGLTFMLYMDTESGTSYDMLKVYVGSAVVWTKSSTTVTQKTWMPISVDLSTYAGQTITIQFEFDTVDSIANSTEGVYIDDVTIYSDC
jgi:hypothetical protein